MSQNTPEYDPELDDPDDDTTGFEDDEEGDSDG